MTRDELEAIFQSIRSVDDSMRYTAPEMAGAMAMEVVPLLDAIALHFKLVPVCAKCGAFRNLPKCECDPPLFR